MLQQLKTLCKCLANKAEANSDGQIRVSGRDTFDYIRGDWRATVYVELLTGRIKRRICVWSIRKWHPPHETEEMTQADKDTILCCLRSYFDKTRIAYDLLEGDPPST